MAPVLYYAEFSPPVRAVLMIAKAIGLELELKSVNVFEGEQNNPEYLKMNPQHTIPTLDDNGFIIWDSHAIAAYLVEKYAKDDSLYPKDLQKRATIDQRLHFDSGMVFPRIKNISFPIMFLNQKTIPEEKMEAMRQSYDFIEKFLEGHTYIAGDQLSIADLCILTSLSTIMLLVPPVDDLPNITRWLNKMKQLPYYEETNGRGVEYVINFIKQKMAETP